MSFGVAPMWNMVVRWPFGTVWRAWGTSRTQCRCTGWNSTKWSSGQISPRSTRRVFRRPTTAWVRCFIGATGCVWDRAGWDVLYDSLSLSKELQTYMWAQFCERVCALAGGRILQDVEVYTGREE